MPDVRCTFRPDDHLTVGDAELIDLERWGFVIELDGAPYPPSADAAPVSDPTTPNSAGDGEEEITP
jgi:hypothetical protein